MFNGAGDLIFINRGVLLELHNCFVGLGWVGEIPLLIDRLTSYKVSLSLKWLLYFGETLKAFGSVLAKAPGKGFSVKFPAISGLIGSKDAGVQCSPQQSSPPVMFSVWIFLKSPKCLKSTVAT